MYIEQLYTNCLAEAAYYIESNGEAAIIDPIRDIDVYIQLAQKRNARITYVFETHFHADFVSGHIDLAQKTKSTIVYGPKANPSYPVHIATDGESFTIGKIRMQVLHTPGHTPESTCYLLWDEAGKEHAVFTGDTLFVGDVGRPDLLDGIMNKEVLAGLLFDSLQKKIKTLPDDVIVYPGHGAGSACGKKIGKETFSTIGIQKKVNYALLHTSKEEFIRDVTKDIPPPPAYFFQDVQINKKGYNSLEEVVAKTNQPLTADEVAQAYKNGCVLLDTRTPQVFEKGFIPGSISIGLNGQYAIWVGTLISITQPLVLITEPGKEEEAIIRLARVGYENVKGFLKGGIEAWKQAGKSVQTIVSVTADEAKMQFDKGIQLIDVRKPSEYAQAHVKNAIHLSLANLPQQLHTLNKKITYMVHCAGGYRSMIAASILKANGFENILNVEGGFDEMKKINFMIVSDEVSSLV